MNFRAFKRLFKYLGRHKLRLALIMLAAVLATVFTVLRPIMSDTVFGLLFAGVAGIMVFISFDELLPAAREYGEHHLSIYGLISGMVVMAISLLLFL